MISLCFRCRYQPGLKLHQVEALQRDIWTKCEKRGLGGFLVQQGSALVGLLEGEQRAAFNCVEAMIRKSVVTSIEVLLETDTETRTWVQWVGGIYRIEDLIKADTPLSMDLAKLIGHPIDGP
ncbi:MAG: BLUF domain-containing protein [Pseudomonadota bacterium]